MYQNVSAQPPNDAHRHHHHGHGSPVGVSPRPAAEPSAPTEPSRAVLLDVGEHTGALVLRAPAEREGLEVEIHPASDPSQRTHVWVLPREAGMAQSMRQCSRACLLAITPCWSPMAPSLQLSQSLPTT